MIPLSSQLKATAKVVAFVVSGRSLNDVLADGSVVKSELRSGVQALSFSVLRHLGMARALRSLLASREPSASVDALLCTALALLTAEPDSGVTYTSFTIVDQAVEAAKGYSKTRTSSSFINAALRRFLRERDTLVRQALADEEALYNHPKWWIDQLRDEYPQHWKEMLMTNQNKSSLTLRVNLSLTSVPEYSRLLTDQGVPWIVPSLKDAKCSADDACAIVLAEHPAIQHLPGYQQGLFSVQDVAAQGAATQLLSNAYLTLLVERARRGHKVRVLDACAAPGGKTTHLIERLLVAFRRAGLCLSLTDHDWTQAFEVVALELSAKRALRIHENLSRLRQRAVVKKVDATDLESWWDGQMFDAILLDAPCTASGIVRRHPDVRWLRRKTDVADLSEKQLLMLKKLWMTLRVGGRLLYATCSIFHAEGEGVKQKFLNEYPQAKALDSHGVWLPVSPQLMHDGFYDALFEKKSCDV